jgi:hypothetical protein
VKFDVPTIVGGPVIAPVDAFNDNPAGKVPVITAHVYGVVPPAATRVAEYAALTTPTGSDVVVIDSAGLIVIESACSAVRAPLSVTPTVKFDVPAVLGVPLITPAEDNDNPAGNVPIARDQEYAGVPPVTLNIWL